MKEKNISLKNYIILAGILIISIVVVIYFYMWYSAYEENKLNTPIMDKYLSVIKYNEVNDYLTENKDAIIYVSTLDDESIREFEKKFKNVIRTYSLSGDILYLNLSSKNIDDFKEKYSLKNLPCIIIYRDGAIYGVYDIKGNNYDIDRLIHYFENEGVIND